MKTIIRIDNVIDSPDRFTDEKVPPLATKLLAEAYAARRDERPEALLIVEHSKDGKPVYITVGPNPPELYVGNRQVHAVFSPVDSQEPLATFFEEAAAKVWSQAFEPDVRVAQIDSTDRPHIQVVVAVLVMRAGKALLGKLEKNGIWTLPEGLLELGESLDVAARRILLEATGMVVERVAISRTVPYANTFFEHTGQHFLTLVMLAIEPVGDPVVVAKQWDEWGFFATEDVPKNLLVTVKQIIAVAKRVALEQAAPSSPPARPRRLKAASARSPGKRPLQRRSRSR